MSSPRSRPRSLFLSPPYMTFAGVALLVCAAFNVVHALHAHAGKAWVAAVLLTLGGLSWTARGVLTFLAERGERVAAQEAEAADEAQRPPAPTS